MHRVWSIDYFNRPDEQMRCVLSALQQSGGEAAATAGPQGNEGVEREEASSRGQHRKGEETFAVPYHEARFRVPSSRDIPDVPVDKLAAIIAKIVEIEGPIHGDEIAERVRQLWDASRLGPKMVRAIDVALEWAVRTNQAYRTGDFYQKATDSPVVHIQ